MSNSLWFTQIRYENVKLFSPLFSYGAHLSTSISVFLGPGIPSSKLRNLKTGKSKFDILYCF